MSSIFWQVIKNPVSDHLPAGAKKYVMSFKADVIDPKTLIPEDGPVVLIVGAMAHGSVSIYIYYHWYWTYTVEPYFETILKIQKTGLKVKRGIVSHGVPCTTTVSIVNFVG